MKKIKKILRFSCISIVLLFILGYIARFLFNLFWGFDIISVKSYQLLSKYWNEGGVFNTFHDCSLGASLFLFPVFWLWYSYKIYKKGFWKSVLSPVEKLYHKMTRPKDLEVAHVSLKNLGGKDKTLDEIISDKIKAQKGDISAEHTVRDLRKEISAKLEENEKK